MCPLLDDAEIKTPSVLREPGIIDTDRCLMDDIRCSLDFSGRSGHGGERCGTRGCASKVQVEFLTANNTLA